MGRFSDEDTETETESRFESLKGKLLKIGVVIIVLSLILVGMMAASFRNIPAGFAGVIVSGPDGGSVVEIGEGWHFIPFWIGIEILPFRLQEVNAIGQDTADDNIGSIAAVSKDNLRVLVDSNLLFTIPQNMVADVRIQYGEVVHSVILPIFRSVPRDVISKYNAFDLRGELRGVIEIEISKALETELAKYSVILNRYALQGIRLDESVEQAIAAKKIAEQNLIKAELEYQITLIQAAAVANSTVILAEGQARAIQVVTEMFQSMDNTTLNAYLLWYFLQALQNPDSNVSYVIIWDGTGVPVILDVTGTTQP